MIGSHRSAVPNPSHCVDTNVPNSSFNLLIMKQVDVSKVKTVIIINTTINYQHHSGVSVEINVVIIDRY